MSDLRTGFFQECDDLLESLSEGLTALEDDNATDDTINAMFRAVHSIKGGAGAFALDHLVEFSHAFENLLDDMRSGKREASPAVVALMFSSSDHLNHLVDQYRADQEPDPAAGHSILGDLRLLNGHDEEADALSAEADAALANSFAPITLEIGGLVPDASAAPEADATQDNLVNIRFQASSEVFRTGNDPALLFRALTKLGTLTVAVDDTPLPPLSELDWHASFLSWELQLELGHGADLTDIHDVFEFVEGIADIEISTSQPSPPPLPDLPAPDLPTREAAVTVNATAPASAAPTTPPPKKTPKTAAAKTPAAQARKPKGTAASSRQTIRVELHKVDRLINLVGELVISEAMLRQSMSELEIHSHGSIDNAMAQLKQLSGILQESVMTIRAQPVRGLFQRMSRIAREVGRETEKDLKVVTNGDSVELDKIVTERLVEPLTHMIRNSVDHGLETREGRAKSGKPERGTITLSAEHRSGRVIITLSDDGGGIDRIKVRQVAESKGLVAPEDDLTDSDVDNLLFMPGFSTNAEVSKLSGRGVGMDVVRSEVHALGGRVTLQSKPGRGTAAIISLPLTLAVLDGMLVRVAEETVVVPTAVLRETYRAEGAEIHDLGESDRVLAAHGALIPIIDLGASLGFRNTPSDISSGSLLLIESNDGRQSALVVDEIFGQREVVIKGLEQNFRQVPGIAAATILGDGNIALIVDTDQLLDPAPHWQVNSPARDAIQQAGASTHA